MPGGDGLLDKAHRLAGTPGAIVLLTTAATVVLERTSGDMVRRKRSRRNQQFGTEEFSKVDALLRERSSPEQISGHLRGTRELLISHKAIYRHAWRDLRKGGILHTHLQRSKRYGSYDSRGRLAGKSMIHERPAAGRIAGRMGHWGITRLMTHCCRVCAVVVRKKFN